MVATLAGVLVAAVPTVKPDQGGGAQLFTLVDNVELAARTSMTYDFVDVQGFSQFRGFFTWESGTASTGNINIHFIESFDGTNSVEKAFDDVFASVDQVASATTCGLRPWCCEVGGLGHWRPSLSPCLGF